MKFDTITDALKWCIDHPNQKLTDKDGREIWFSGNLDDGSFVRFITNVYNGNAEQGSKNILFKDDCKFFDLPTLSPQKTKAPLPKTIKTQDIEDILKRVQELEKRFEEAKRWPVISPFVGVPVLGSSAGWPVEG